MTWTAPDVTRTDEPGTGDERTLLLAFLDLHRRTLLLKCAGLTADQLRQRSVPPSALSLLGLLRHMVDVERSWFRRRVDGQDVPFAYCSDADPDGDFDNVDTADAAADHAAYLAEIELCDRVLERVPLDHEYTRRDGSTASLRWTILHLIEEYARHNGHADLLREAIDGTTGE